MLLKDLFAILVGDDELADPVGEDFLKMLDLLDPMFREVNRALWSGKIPDELRMKTYERDVQINQLERSVRKRTLAHLAAQDGPRDIPYCFILINVVKDAERIGDYVKNLAEVEVISTLAIPEGDIRDGLAQLGRESEQMVGRVRAVFQQSNRSEAEGLVRKGRALKKESEVLLRKIAGAGYDSRATTSLVLITRFYKRIVAHAANILSTVIMPVHKIDFFDEDELRKAGV